MFINKYDPGGEFGNYHQKRVRLHYHFNGNIEWVIPIYAMTRIINSPIYYKFVCKKQLVETNNYISYCTSCEVEV